MSTTPKTIHEVVAQRVADRTGRRVRNLEVEVSHCGQQVTLRGRTASFHVKQLAQHGAREALPHARLENAIVVE